MAKVTITIEDIDTSIGSVFIKVEAEPMPTRDFETQAHILGVLLHKYATQFMIRMKGGEKDGKKEEG